jgi:hypothetical protein
VNPAQSSDTVSVVPCERHLVADPNTWNTSKGSCLSARVCNPSTSRCRYFPPVPPLHLDFEQFLRLNYFETAKNMYTREILLLVVKHDVHKTLHRSFLIFFFFFYHVTAYYQFINY